MRGRSQEYPGEGLRVGRLWLDQGFAFEMHPSRDPATEGALLRLYLSFAIERDGDRQEFTAHDHARLLPAFDVLGGHVIAAQMTGDARFRVRLDNELTLVAGSLDERDYWEFQQPWRRTSEAARHCFGCSTRSSHEPR
jgi:hypothetical protein